MILKNTVGKHALFSQTVKQNYLYGGQYKELASTKLLWSKIYSSSSDSIDWDCKPNTFNCVHVPTHIMETRAIKRIVVTYSKSETLCSHGGHYKFTVLWPVMPSSSIDA